MDENTGHGKTYFQGAEVREGRILASNTDRQVEDSYETAYNLGCGKKKWDGWINVDLHSNIADIRSWLTDDFSWLGELRSDPCSKWR